MEGLKGFTLVELMIGIAVLAIMTVIGLPAFSGIFERSRADADVNELLRAMNLARIEAINHSEEVKVSATSDEDWARDLLIERDGVVIRRYGGLIRGAVVSATDGVDSIIFDGQGGLGSPGSAVVFRYTRGDSRKNLVVCPTGRILTGVSCI
ncbi:GspH/FimT family pseudopilin [Halopseudomonas sp.]|uniref:GspH/FimT family pseudopilin n=1 Tax=Halopseudomonas sp. TaxID=2901191 RepID=UPI003FA5D24F